MRGGAVAPALLEPLAWLLMLAFFALVCSEGVLEREGGISCITTTI